MPFQVKRTTFTGYYMKSMKTIFSFLILLLAFSCTPPEDFIYFQDDAEAQAQLKTPEFNGLTIKTDDILAVQISSVDARASQPYNMSGTADLSGQSINDFLVDADGNIDYPGIGRLAVAGLTVKELKAKLREKVSPFVVDAVINVRILNFKITVLGEVKLPSVYPQTDEKVSVLDAIGMAGDLTDFANREGILLIREGDEKQEVFPLSLTSKAILGDPNFYLQQNDVIYVPPVQQKTKYARSEPVGRLLLPALGVATALVSLIIVATNNR